MGWDGIMAIRTGMESANQEPIPDEAIYIYFCFNAFAKGLTLLFPSALSCFQISCHCHATMIDWGEQSEEVDTCENNLPFPDQAVTAKEVVTPELKRQQKSCYPTTSQRPVTPPPPKSGGKSLYEVSF